jgi:hypothetical protein
MVDWDKVHKALVGRKFRRRKGGHQETRLVVDTTFGGEVCFRYGPRMTWKKQIPYGEWDRWQADAKEVVR